MTKLASRYPQCDTMHIPIWSQPSHSASVRENVSFGTFKIAELVVSTPGHDWEPDGYTTYRCGEAVPCVDVEETGWIQRAKRTKKCQT